MTGSTGKVPRLGEAWPEPGLPGSSQHRHHADKAWPSGHADPPNKGRVDYHWSVQSHLDEWKGRSIPCAQHEDACYRRLEDLPAQRRQHSLH